MENENEVWNKIFKQHMCKSRISRYGARYSDMNRKTNLFIATKT